MKMSTLSNLTWGRAIVNLLYSRGVRHVCISPGSRSTPITSEFINHKKIKCFSHIDERSGSFFGLGLAKTSKKPVVIITTSGTAAANTYPSVIDAKLSKIPLIIITADRPLRMINTGATQTINQKNLFGDYVLDMLDIDHQTQNPEKLLQKIDLCIDTALGLKNVRQGPIHLNLRFDLPLYKDCNSNMTTPNKNKRYSLKLKTYSLPNFKRPLIIAGPTLDNRFDKAIIKFSKKINAPIFADSLSQMRHYRVKENVCSMYEHYIEDLPNPDIIFRFNDKPTSKKVNDFLDKNYKDIYLITDHEKFNDNAYNTILTNPKNLTTKIKLKHAVNTKWINNISDYEITLTKKLDKKISTLDFQGKLFNQSVKKFKKGSHVFIGSSTPIRSFDEFSGPFKKHIHTMGNHITRGIDGIISSALGMSYINKKNNFLYIGDISFFYDINAFHILNNTSFNLVIVIINNNGGQIFSRLPYASKKIKDFDKFWITPVKTNIKNVAKLFNLKYFKTTINDYIDNIHSISSLKGIKLVEINISNKKDLDCIKKLTF